MRFRKVLGLDRLSDAVAPYINISGRVPVSHRDEADYRLFDDGSTEIAMLPGSTGHTLRHGIGKKLSRLARSYGIDRYIPIAPGDVVINCGANIGALTLGLAARGAKVIAVEPDPTTLKVLRRNTAALSNVEILPIGLWNADGMLTFYQAPRTADTSAINHDGPPISIMANTVDTVCRERGIARLKLLIGDAEGAEPEVIEGATATLANAEFFSMECGYERRGERTLEKCTALLKERGFKVVHVTRRNRLIAKRRN